MDEVEVQFNTAELARLMEDDQDVREFVEEVFFDETPYWQKVAEIYTAYRGSMKALVGLVILGELNVMYLTGYYDDEEVTDDALWKQMGNYSQEGRR